MSDVADQSLPGLPRPYMAPLIYYGPSAPAAHASRPIAHNLSRWPISDGPTSMVPVDSVAIPGRSLPTLAELDLYVYGHVCGHVYSCVQTCVQKCVQIRA